MKIIRVEAENLKGRTFGYDLSPQVAIVGDNFTGKSSIIDAIRLALIGYIPELGKLPKATKQLMSDEFMTARVEFDNGSDARLEINETQEHKLPWAIDRREIPLLNASAYFAMSERERYQYVFNIAKTPEEFTPESIVAECERISFEELTSEALVRAKAKFVSFVIGCLTGRSIQEGLQEAIDDLAGHFKAFNARSKDTQGAIRVLTELKNRQKAFAGNARELAEEEEAARVKMKATFEAMVKTKERRNAEVRYAEREARVKELQKNVHSMEETEKLAKLVGEASASLKPEVESKYSESEVAAMEATRAKLFVEMNNTSVLLRTKKAELEALEIQNECPHCGAKGKHWKTNLRHKLESELPPLDDVVEKLAKALASEELAIYAAKENIQRAQSDLAHNKVVNAKILDWQSQIDKIAAWRRGWEQLLKKELRELDTEKVEPLGADELAKSVSDNDAAEKAYMEARRRFKEAQLLEQDLKRAAQSQLEHEDAVANVTVIKAVGKILREKQAALVDLVFGDLLKVANGIVGNVLASPLAFHDGEIGRWNSHRWISHKTFSGTEQALTFVAIAAALSLGAPLRLLIFDEIGRLDDARRVLLLNLLILARKDGFIDQWIVAGTELPEAIPAEIQVIAL